MNVEPPTSLRNIAVVVIHGVGDQKPLESARAIGDLLQDLDIDQKAEDSKGTATPCVPPVPVESRYDPFTERPLRINVRPVIVSDNEPAGRSVQGPFHAHVDRMYRERQRHTNAGRRVPAAATADDDIATMFMRGQLRCYGGDTPEETYETVRLEGTRRADGGPARPVHVYELYWADLSRLKAGLLSIFTELYQLLFHLPSLGTHVVDAETTQHLTPAWQRFRKAQGAAAVALVLPIPALNIFMMAVTGIVAATAALYKIPPNWLTVAALAVVAGAVTALVGGVWWRATSLSTEKWIAPVCAWLAVVVVVAVFRAHIDVRVGHVAAQVTLVALAVALIEVILGAYDERRPGARRRGWMVGAIAVLAGIAASAIKLPAGTVYSRILIGWVRVFEVMYLALGLAWGIFAVLAIWAFIAGALAVRSVGDAQQRRLASKGMWTARLMLSLPGAAFLSITLAGWALVSFAIAPMLTGIPYTPLVPMGTTSVTDWCNALLDTSGGIALPVILTAAALAALPAAWGMVPVVLSEVWPPPLQRACDTAYSSHLGRWLTRTFDGLSISGFLLVAAMTFALPALGIAVMAARLGLATNYLAGFPSLLTAARATGAASGIIFAWMFAIRGDLKKLALGFAPVLDILLDVDNWLREHPRSRNPRARICGRYVSLLRYVCEWSDPATGRGYDAIVIVAHSQGTVITADLLRFLAIDRDPKLRRLEGPDALPVYLFTMGCPLRQLYGERFPRLYAWATHDDDLPMTAWQPNDLATPPRESVDPDPQTLRVRKWINAYRSGDYIGRYLWRTDACDYLWTPDSSGSPRPISVDNRHRVEFCIGAGAHTHYWDATARPIAWTLDELIAGA